jgi:mRNA interferase ChpB
MTDMQFPCVDSQQSGRARTDLMQRSDIYFVSLDPTSGHEQQGQRPVEVITPGEFNTLTDVPVVLPITSGGNFARVYGIAVSLSGIGLTMQGVVRCDQPRVLDLRARNARRTRERVPDAISLCQPAWGLTHQAHPIVMPTEVGIRDFPCCALHSHGCRPSSA